MNRKQKVNDMKEWWDNSSFADLLASSQFRFTILIIILLIIFASFTKGGRAMLGPVLLWITQQILMRMFALMKRVIWAHKVLILNLFTPRSVIFRSIAKKDDSKE